MALASRIVHPTPPLTGCRLRTYDRIFQHPVSHNLGWHDVHALFRHLGQVETEPNGKLKVIRNGQTMVLHPPRAKDVADTEELMELRHFLQRSEAALIDAPEAENHWLLVIDHREARIFRSEMQGDLPLRILPHAPEDYFRHARQFQDFSRGKEKPDPNSFFEPIAQALRGAGQVLVFGTGTGMSSEMDQFVAWSKNHHPELAKRIIGSLVVDELHLTEGQLLAKARKFYARGPEGP